MALRTDVIFFFGPLFDCLSLRRGKSAVSRTARATLFALLRSSEQINNTNCVLEAVIEVCLSNQILSHVIESTEDEQDDSLLNGSW